MTHAEEQSNERPIILVVEDDLDFLTFLVSELGREFQVLSAANGRDGLGLATESLPDLIVTDLKMPIMGGLEMCEKLKSDIETSHIPIIMLTSRSSVDHQIEGLQTADDYVTKPFNLKILKARITNLLESRRLLRDQFNRELMQSHQPHSGNVQNDTFLNEVVNMLEAHSTDPDFTADQFADLMQMSLSSLHRKLKTLCGETPAKMIWNMRLKIAGGLLISTDHRITDVAFMVGFTDSNHFSRLFKKHFKTTPSLYRESKGSSAAF